MRSDNSPEGAAPLAGRRATAATPPAAAPTGSASSPRSLLVYLALLFGLFPIREGSEAVGAALVLIAVAASWRELKPVPRAVLVLVVGGAVLALAFEPRLLLSAAVAAARLSSLVIAVMLLSATLGRSRGLEELAAGLMGGRPLPRYLGVAGATGVLALPLNFGSVALMSAIVARLIRHGGDTALTRNVARAAMRGFAAASLGSPLSISLAVTLTLLPGSTAQGLLAISVPFACFFLLLGVAFREPEGPSADAAGIEAVAVKAASAWRAWLRFAAWLAAICIAAFTLYGAFAMPYARAVSLACAGAALAALFAARRRGDPAAPPALGSTGNELSVMSGSAFLGVIASSVGLSALGSDFAMPAAAWPLLCFCVPWFIYGGGMLGLNPIVTGTLVGATLGPMAPATAIDALGIAISAGWSMAVAGTPYSANSMLLQRITGYDPHVAAFRWNLRLSIATLTVAGLLAAMLTQH